jgi:hypothetical protein
MESMLCHPIGVCVWGGGGWDWGHVHAPPNTMVSSFKFPPCGNPTTTVAPLVRKSFLHVRMGPTYMYLVGMVNN